MNNENTQKLISSSPLLYRGVELPITHNLMPFGFDCGDGWFELLLKLSQELEKLISQIPDPKPMALQVKEKFGTLRFYLTSGTDEMYNLIDAAEIRSGSICERCGKAGQILDHNGWYMTRCPDCIGDKNDRQTQQRPEGPSQPLSALELGIG